MLTSLRSLLVASSKRLGRNRRICGIDVDTTRRSHLCALGLFSSYTASSLIMIY